VPARPHSPVSTWLRLAAAFAWFGVTTTGLMAVQLLLLPSRRLRLRASSAFVHRISPPILRILGVELRVDGAERIQRSEPAIFLINHSSNLDTFASMALWPRLGCGIGKKEVIWIPFFGVAYVLGGNLRIDRSDPTSAIATMNAMVATVHQLGLSPWIAPEGTRRKEPDLGPFKKGFAHIALASGLPCVPVVIHDARSLWPNPGFRITPGTLHVEVLEPIPTGDWTTETLDQHVTDVRQAFVEALAQGPRGD
jgi:lysophosphatidate acyltransferase